MDSLAFGSFVYSAFLLREISFAKTIVDYLESSLQNLKSVIQGKALITPIIQSQAKSLLIGRVPSQWTRFWEGPEHSASAWIRAVMRR